MHPLVEFIQNENRRRREVRHVGADTLPIRVTGPPEKNAIHIETPPDVLLQMKHLLDRHKIETTGKLSRVITHELAGGRQGTTQHWIYTVDSRQSSQNKELVDSAHQHGIVTETKRK